MSGKPGYNVPRRCLVTGGSGFVGQRLVEMLVERGAEHVVSFDIAPSPKDAMQSSKITYVQGDLTNYESVAQVCENVDCVFHIAALVGPYHPKEAYKKVNYEGTLNVLNACKHWGIKKIVMSSSPSTRFPYPDPNIRGYSEEQLFKKNNGHYAPKFLQPYAETKAMGEKVVLEACGKEEGDLLTIAVAPHQVYGPRDGLFLPNFLEVAASRKLRIFGDGQNLISFCHVDNYCHGLILGSEALYPGSPALGKFYVVTDGPPVKFWDALDDAIVYLGFQSLHSKMHLPGWFMLALAHVVLYIGNLFAAITGIPQHRINYHLKLNPFAVKMLLIHRYFNISAAERDLNYHPVKTFQKGWEETKVWFKEHWLPEFQTKKQSKAKHS